MKTFHELTNIGKQKRCERALSIVESNCNNSICCEGATMQLFDVLDTKRELRKAGEFVVDSYQLTCALLTLRELILEANKYRGYSNYNPLSEVTSLLY